MTIEEYFGDWKKVINLQEANTLLNKVSSVRICPLLKDVYKAFHYCSLKDLRVVILGQDPYSNHIKGVPVATGIAFANAEGTPEENYSPSLEILRESVIDFTIPHRTVIFDPCLEKWEAQGVLMLNTALSCEFGKTGSHILKWRPFISSLLTNLSKYHTGIVYVLMGTAAQSFAMYINKQFNHIINVKHPSWYARNKEIMPSDIWRQINKILINQNGKGIKWYEEY